MVAIIMNFFRQILATSLITGFALLLSFGTASAFYLFDGFERESLEQADLSYTGPIGLVEFRNGQRVYRCTGALVAPDIVLTNAHCLIGEVNGLRSGIEALSFFPFADRAEFRRGRLGRRFRADPGSRPWMGKREPDDNTIPSDWALFRLKEEVRGRNGSQTAAYLPVLLIDGPMIAELFRYGISSVSYNGDINKSRLEVVRDCLAQRQKSWEEQVFNTVDMVAHSCSGRTGSSGAPLLGEVNGTKYLLGVHVGGQYSEDPKAGLSVQEVSDKKMGDQEIGFDDYGFNVGAPSLSFYATLRQLQSVPSNRLNRNDKREIQQRLMDMGFSVGRVDGLFGPKTRAAVSVFQKTVGALSTGRLTSRQLKLLKSNSFKAMSSGGTSKKVYEVDSESLLDSIDQSVESCQQERSDCRVLAVVGTEQCMVHFWGLPVHRTVVFDNAEKSDLNYRILLSGFSPYMNRRVLVQNCWDEADLNDFSQRTVGPHSLIQP
jgi:hypothetical protein